MEEYEISKKNKTGIIEVRGRAQRRVVADIVMYKFTFLARDSYLSKAIQKVTEHCDVFLAEVKKIGIEIEKMRLEADCVSEKNGGNEKVVERKISFITNADTAINNAILKIIELYDFDVELDVGYGYSQYGKVCEELIEKATFNSKNTADVVAHASQQKIIGISSAQINKSDHYDSGKKYFYEDDDIDYDDISITNINEKSSLSDSITGNELIISETVTIEWIVE